jgi:hypothetical protein
MAEPDAILESEIGPASGFRSVKSEDLPDTVPGFFWEVPGRLRAGIWGTTVGAAVFIVGFSHFASMRDGIAT